jgi:hypothetical protein
MRRPDDLPLPPDRPLDRSTSSLSDPRPETPAAAAMREALVDTTVRPDAVHPSAAGAPAHADHPDAPGAAGGGAGDDRAGAGDEIGEAVGGISGVLTGAAIGSLGGPIGTIIGGVAGAVSGWWAGRAISEAAAHAEHDDAYYRGRHAGGEHAAGAAAAPSYDDVRPAYQLGHLAGRNPDYRGRAFDEVERDLRHGWTAEVSARHGSWERVRGYARDAFERSRAAVAAPVPTGRAAGTATGGTATERSASAPATGSLDVGAASRGDGPA